MPEAMNGVKNEERVETVKAVRRRDLSDAGAGPVVSMSPVIIPERALVW
jgi:hypothetical protein